jgi:hypothetical protein
VQCSELAALAGYLAEGVETLRYGGGVHQVAGADLSKGSYTLPDARRGSYLACDHLVDLADVDLVLTCLHLLFAIFIVTVISHPVGRLYLKFRGMRSI